MCLCVCQLSEMKMWHHGSKFVLLNRFVLCSIKILLKKMYQSPERIRLMQSGVKIYVSEGFKGAICSP